MVKSKKDDPQAGADGLAELLAAGLAALSLTDGAAARLRRICMGDGGTDGPALLQTLSQTAAAGLPDDRLAQALFAPSDMTGAVGISSGGTGETAHPNAPTDGKERSGGGRTQSAQSLRSALLAAYDGAEAPSASGASPLLRSLRVTGTGDGVGQSARRRVPKRSDAAGQSADTVSGTPAAEKKDTGEVFGQPGGHAALSALSVEGAAFTALSAEGASLSALSAEGASLSALSAGDAARGFFDRPTDRAVSSVGRTGDGQKPPERGTRETSAAPVLIQPPLLTGQSADPPLSVFGRAFLSTRDAAWARGDAGEPLKSAVGAANAFVRLTGETSGALGTAGQFASGVWLSPAGTVRGTAGMSGLAEVGASAARSGGWSVLENRLGAAVGGDGAPVFGADDLARRGASAVSRTDAWTVAPEADPRRVGRTGAEKGAWSSTERRRTADGSDGFGSEGQAARLSSFDRLRDAAGGGASAGRAFEQLEKACASLFTVADGLSSDGQAGGALPLLAGERAAALLWGTAEQTDPDRYAGAPVYLTVNANSTLSSEVDVETYIGELTDRIAAALSASASSVHL